MPPIYVYVPIACAKSAICLIPRGESVLETRGPRELTAWALPSSPLRSHSLYLGPTDERRERADALELVRQPYRLTALALLYYDKNQGRPKSLSHGAGPERVVGHIRIQFPKAAREESDSVDSLSGGL